MKGFIKNFFYLEEEEQAEQQVEHKQQTKSNVQQQVAQPTAIPNKAKKERKVTKQEVVATNNVVSIHTATANNGAKVVLSEPRVYAEAQDIAENLKNRRATIVNLQRIDRESGIRIIDFLSGTVYALGGDIQRIGTDIFLCTPENVEVSGEISDYLIDES